MALEFLPQYWRRDPAARVAALVRADEDQRVVREGRGAERGVESVREVVEGEVLEVGRGREWGPGFGRGQTCW